MRRSFRVLSVVFLVVVLYPFPIAAQVSGPWAECRPDSLATWNCARYYSGTVTLKSELKGAGVDESVSITATVADGRVTCRVAVNDVAPFEAPGMLAVVQQGTTGAGGYEILVWCPSAADEAVTRRDAPTIQTYDQSTADYATLAGTDSHDHPDADPVNGLAGTETITWSLRRR